MSGRWASNFFPVKNVDGDWSETKLILASFLTVVLVVVLVTGDTFITMCRLCSQPLVVSVLTILGQNSFRHPADH